MKHKFTLFTILIGMMMNVQSQTYNFSASTGSYANLTGSTSLNNGLIWDDPELEVPIGFNFKYYNYSFDTILISGLGGLLTIPAGFYDTVPVLLAYGADIIDRGEASSSSSLSNISYKKEGTAGSRILKIEWNNAGFYGDINYNGVSTDYINFQVWLYEGSNNIEIHFGPNSITKPLMSYDGETGTHIALIPEFHSWSDEIVKDGICLSGNPSSPTIATLPTMSSMKYLNGNIPNGTIYKFSTGGSTSIEKLNKNNFELTLYPNPSSDFITINFNNELHEINKISIMNAEGKIVKEFSELKDNQIDVSDLRSGIFIVQVTTASGSNNVKKFTKI